MSFKEGILTRRRNGAASFFAPLRRRVSIFLFALTLAGCSRGPSGPLAFVTNERDGTITVIDTGAIAFTQRSKSVGLSWHPPQS